MTIEGVSSYAGSNFTSTYTTESLIAGKPIGVLSTIPKDSNPRHDLRVDKLRQKGTMPNRSYQDRLSFNFCTGLSFPGTIELLISIVSYLDSFMYL